VIDERPIIAALQMDEAAQAFFDALRARWFPPRINYLKAHLTLFHALPSDDAEETLALVARECATTPPMRLRAAGLIRLGRGVAYRIDGPALPAFRARLAGRFAGRLTPQDRENFRPHVTVQNKVAPEEAEALLARLENEFAPFDLRGEGVQLWRYDGGPWAPMAAIAFQGEGE